MWRPTVSPDELYHHGILGMSWGKRNGPPYPLGSEDHSAKEKKAGWRKSLGGGSNTSEKDKKKQQKAFVKDVVKRHHMKESVYDAELANKIKESADPKN